jgi:ABC-type Na+ efflux pump permease subunit
LEPQRTAPFSRQEAGSLAGRYGEGCALLLTACVSRRDGLLLVGPFVRSELVRAARTRRLALWRTLYAVVTGGLMLLFFVRATTETAEVVGDRYLARLAEGFFVTFSVIQFAYLVYLTISVISPIAAEERESKRWDFLLATDLRAREILFGKAVGRLPLILDPVLASLPILALSTLFGGVSPRMVVAVAVATLAAVLGTAGVAFFYTVFSPTAKQANERTSGLLVAYLVFSGLLVACRADPDVWEFPSTAAATSPVEVGDVVRAATAGNPFAAVGFVGMDVSAGQGDFESLFETAVRKFVAFQAGVFLLFGLIAAARLRSATPWARTAKAKPTGEGAAEKKPRPVPDRPPVGSLPVYWWERYGGLTRGQIWVLGRMTPTWYVAVGVLAAVVLLAVRAADPYWVYGPDKLAKAVQMFFNIGLGMVCAMVYFTVAVRAVRSVARERAADTLDGLRLTALTPRDILFEKWLAAVRADGPVYLTCLTVAAAGVATGNVHPAGLLGLAVCVPVYAGSTAAVGLYFSVRASNAVRAARNMVVICGPILYVVGSWAVTASGRLESPIPAMVAIPPVATGAGLALGFETAGPTSEVVVQGVVGVVAGMAVYAGIGWLAWRRAVDRFERERQD